MVRFKRLVTAVLLLGLAGFSSLVALSPVAGATTMTVTNCSDSGAGSLRQAIGNATSGTTIAFALSPACTTITLAGTITVSTSITIDGPGASSLAVSGNNSTSVFQIDSGTTVAVSDLTISDGSAADNGGGIDNSGALTITDATLSDNSADNGGGGGGGGAIDNNGGNLTITDSDFSDNVSGEDDGGGGLGGAIDNGGGTVTISGSTFTDNQATDGGAVDNGDALIGGGKSGGTVTVSDSTFSGNNAGVGGAIDNADNGGTGSVTLTGSTVSEDSAGLVGGGGINNDGTFDVVDSVLSDNAAASRSVGGGIDNGGDLDITGSTIAGNTTGDNSGGGIYGHGGSLTITDSTLSGNTAIGDGGAIESVKDAVTITDSTLSGNKATAGGGMANDHGTDTITSTTFSGNNAEHSGDGGSIDSAGGTLNVAATIVTNTTVGSDCSGTITDVGYNLDNDGSCGFSAANHSLSDMKPELGPLQNNGGPTETQAPAAGSPVLDQIPVGTVGNGVTLCPGTDQRGVSRPQETACDIGAVELSPSAQTITSAATATATEGASFSFTVTTAGTPVPTLSEKGKLPKRVKFKKSSTGTATISGKPKSSGIYHLTIKATFGTGAGKYVASQAFTLTVNAN